MRVTPWRGPRWLTNSADPTIAVDAACTLPEAVQVATDPDTFSSKVSRFLQLPNGLDGEEHARFRALIDRYFAHERMAALRPGIEEIARQMVAELPRGTTLNAVRDIGGGDPQKAVQGMIERTVEEMYRTDRDNEFLEVTYQNGDKEIMYFKDFASGAMIENIVRRAKKLAIKRVLADGPKGIRLSDMIESIHQEYKEHEDLPNTTNPDDWAKISGKKGERIIYVRTIVNREDGAAAGGRSIERVATGQYL